jgi:N-methylhydantoinase A
VSAFGLLTVDVRDDYVRTSVGRHDSLDLAAVASIFGELTDRARDALLVEGFRIEQHVFERTADLRYLGQAYEVPVACPPGEVSPDWADRVADGFHESHRALYGYDFRGNPAQQVEWVNMRVTGLGPIPRPEIPEIGPSTGGAVVSVRPVFFESWRESAVYDRSLLGVGDVVVGPAVVQEFGSTVPVHPGFIGTVDRFGNLLITRSTEVVS